MKCSNELCNKTAVVQFDHNGKVVTYCANDWSVWKAVMNAISAPIPISYPVGTKPIE